ncbi:zinc finger BED domain-containing protein RICESLEEPER 2-like [Rutidosis leptorrhynchoides]|uniref:zinc finger BED domain-containing protein RICESLEEPER 2-like n=1 Tax=Rutidosis leptorrhynchoides TaxID=125765 RepID=UPI003A99F3F3
MVVTAHFIDDSWKLHKRIISFKPVYSHRGEEIGREILDCLHDWGINHLMTITTDNASYNDTALDGMKTYKSPLDHAVKYIRNSTTRCDLFKACVDELKLESKAMLHLDCPTRWNSTYDMLDTTEKLKEAFNLYESKDRSYVHNLGEEIPSSFFNEVFDLDYQLDKLKTDRDLEYRVMASVMKDKFDKYWGSIKKLNMLMYFAVVLDPRMKISIVRFGFKRICDMKTYKRLEVESDEEFQVQFDHLKRKDVEDHVSIVDDGMKILYEEYRIMYEEGSSNVNSENQGYVENMIHQENEFVEAFLKESDNSNVDSATELEKYKAEPRIKNGKGV